jgi:hypothetical protein
MGAIVPQGETIMKLGTLATILSVTTLIGVAPAAALNQTGPSDATGQSTLGTDISRAGGSPASVQQFLAQLQPDARNSVIMGCQNALNDHDPAFNPSVLSFCMTATGRVATSFNYPAPPPPAYAVEPAPYYGEPNPAQ